MQWIVEHTEKQMPTGHMRSITFDILSEADSVNISAKLIGAVSQVTDPALKPPNLANQCDTCRPKTEECVKRTVSTSMRDPSNNCKYCDGKWRDSYPPMKFSVSTKDVFTKTAITAEVKESLSRNRSSDEVIASDYWSIIPSDAQAYPSNLRSNKCFLSHAQVYFFLKDVDPRFLQSFLKRKSSIFLNCFLLTPNFHRVTEVGQRITFDRSTKHYKKFIGFRGTANELSTHALDCIKISKVHSEKSSAIDSAFNMFGYKESAVATSGLKYIKELLPGKRSNHAFRMVVVVDPKIKLGEIGVPWHVAELLQQREYDG